MVEEEVVFKIVVQSLLLAALRIEELVVVVLEMELLVVVDQEDV
jgi:hypothetical protein